MKIKLTNPFRSLSLFERILWITSLILVTGSFLCSPEKNVLSLIASLIGVTALIFLAKGYVIGQILIIVFAVFYGLISFYFRYYGEMITYLGMSTPIAIIAVISWIRNPFMGTREVRVHRVKGKEILILVLLAVPVTVLFYFLLGHLGTENLLFSTLSVTTSFLAASMTFLRSPYYALLYSLNDLVLIALWVLATVEDIAYLPMIVCFAVFFVNDFYGFVSWKRREKRQNAILLGKASE